MARQVQSDNIHAFRRTRPRRRSAVGFPLALVICAAFGFLLIYSGFAPSVWQRAREAATPVQATRVGDIVTARIFPQCSNPGTATCVIDGDTFRLNGVRIRISDVDTPEVFSPQCPEELARGNAATRRMVQLLSAGSFEMVRYDSRDEDIYGRKLRVLMRDGQSLGQILIAEGLARTWDGARHPWC